jgi:hypothetical protein
MQQDAPWLVRSQFAAALEAGSRPQALIPEEVPAISGLASQDKTADIGARCMAQRLSWLLSSVFRALKCSLA